MAPVEEVMQARTVVMRNIDDCLFQAIVLRVDSAAEEADIAYVDDGNVERSVPFDELSEAAEELLIWHDAHEQIFLDGHALLAADEGNNSRPSTAIEDSMRWEQGRYVAMDGSVILSCPAGVLGAEVVKEEPAVVSPAASAPPPACGAGLRGIRTLRKNRPDTGVACAAV
eukprot:gnl/TRDRNA2_/TRDRNA2_197316_c0_seq1.p1 gnl/TRDRNA2_/TRDRNA2_197316_c0~~gnl/TRDRNA2_/TRDRNA2_197316_c0_seq1.p1  ORF type:complete len:190 (+),score=38.28 gnl/TRDRNA2_/TRDRNA2_197316_c0_seq1:62-571(+)